METWRLLAGMCVLLVIWAMVITALGQRPGPLGIASAVVFAVIGMYMGERLSSRFSDD